MSTARNKFLDHDVSDDSDLDNGYDSEAVELSRSARVGALGRSVKRRKLSHSDEDDEEQSLSGLEGSGSDDEKSLGGSDEVDDEADPSFERLSHSQHTNTANVSIPRPNSPTKQSKSKTKIKDKDKDVKPGVIYLSSLPPYLKPSALRNLLIQRGFSPITRLFLTPASKAKSTSKKNSRQLYTEGWVEFASKKTAKRCADGLNAQIIGGRKGGFYHDDIWNMKYLRGMGWSELMAGIREEKREEEGRRDEERRTIAMETKRFVEGVEKGRRVEGMKRKRREKQDAGVAGRADIEGDVKRTWRQFGVKGQGKQTRPQQGKISDDAKEVLGKIF